MAANTVSLPGVAETAFPRFGRSRLNCTGNFCPRHLVAPVLHGPESRLRPLETTLHLTYGRGLRRGEARRAGRLPNRQIHVVLAHCAAIVGRRMSPARRLEQSNRDDGER